MFSVFSGWNVEEKFKSSVSIARKLLANWRVVYENVVDDEVPKGFVREQDMIVNWELMNCCGISSLEQSAAGVQVFLLMQSFKNLSLFLKIPLYSLS